MWSNNNNTRIIQGIVKKSFLNCVHRFHIYDPILSLNKPSELWFLAHSYGGPWRQRVQQGGDLAGQNLRGWFINVYLLYSLNTPCIFYIIVAFRVFKGVSKKKTIQSRCLNTNWSRCRFWEVQKWWSWRWLMENTSSSFCSTFWNLHLQKCTVKWI